MKIEILLACMNQMNMDFLSSVNSRTDLIAISQGDKDFYMERYVEDSHHRLLGIKQRGLTRSRNLALAATQGDIALICDDDISYRSDYKEIVLNAFTELPDAAVIIFNVEINRSRGREKPSVRKLRRAPFFRSYSSVRIAFRTEMIRNNAICFNTCFGSGSIYSSGEETLFLNSVRKKGLKIYEYPATISKQIVSSSSWFSGFNEKYFYDKGALLAAAYPLWKRFLVLYYIATHRTHTDLSAWQIIQFMNAGIKGYRSLQPFHIYSAAK